MAWLKVDGTVKGFLMPCGSFPYKLNRGMHHAMLLNLQRNSLPILNDLQRVRLVEEDRLSELSTNRVEDKRPALGSPAESHQDKAHSMDNLASMRCSSSISFVQVLRVSIIGDSGKELGVTFGKLDPQL